MVPEAAVAGQFHKYLKNDIFGKDSNVTGIKSEEEKEKQLGSLIMLSFNNMQCSKWVETNAQVKDYLMQRKWWTKEALLEWLETTATKPTVGPDDNKMKEPSIKSASTPTNNTADINDPSTSSGEIIQIPDPDVSTRTTESQRGQVNTESLVFPPVGGELEVAFKEDIMKKINITLGNNGPTVTISNEAMLNLGIESDHGDQGGMNALIEISPALVRQNLDLFNELAVARSKIEELARDNFSANTTNIDLQSQLVSCRKEIGDLKKAMSDKEMDLVSMKGNVVDTLNELKSEVTGNKDQMKTLREDVLKYLGRVLDSKNSKMPVSNNPWTRAVCDLKDNFHIFLSSSAAEHLTASKMFGDDISALSKADVLSIHTASSNSLKEYIQETKNIVNKGPNIFYLEYEPNSSSGDELMDQIGVTSIKSTAERLLSLTKCSHDKLTFISLPSETGDIGFAKEVEATLGGISQCINMNSRLDDTADNNSNPVVRGLAEVIVNLCKTAGMTITNPCEVCSGFCVGSDCLLTAKEVTRVKDDSPNNNNVKPSRNYSDYKEGVSSQPKVKHINVLTN